EKNATDQITRLITQLGSRRFAERETATRTLDTLGAPALPALKKASQVDDPEIARRAEELVARIEKRIEAAQLLEPKLRHLHFVDAPLAEVLAELKRQTGYPVQLGPDAGRLAGRKVTLDTGLVPFWQALNSLCRQAGVSERGTLLQGGAE